MQPLSRACVGFRGLPIGRASSDGAAWYGDADLMPHFIGILSTGAVDVTVTWGEAVAYDMSAGRKQIARDAERAVRRVTAAAPRATPDPASIAPAPIPAGPLSEAA